MFVKWKKRKSGREPNPYAWRSLDDKGFVTYTATLVEAVRVNGKPRQRHVAVLASVRTFDEPGCGHRPREYQAMQLPDGRYCYTRWSLFDKPGSAGFWIDARKRLASLDLTDSQVQQIEAAIAKVIPEPAEHDLQRERDHNEKRQAELRQWYAEQGMTSPFGASVQGQPA